MPPHQLFPYDEFGGVRAPFQLLGEIPGTQDAHNDVTSTNKPSASATISPDEEVEHLCFSDIEDALDDDDDEDGALESNWQRRDVVSRRGIEIFVGGLTRSTRRDMLRDWFQHAGEVTEVRIARDKRRRRCRGYGYVRFATSEQANRAIETMHRFEFKPGRFLGVLPSDENRTLFVGGLKEEWGCDYICKLLKDKMPGLRKVEPIPDREDRFKIRTFCFLEFETHADAAVVFNRHHGEALPSRNQQQYPVTADADALSSAGSSSAAFECDTRASTGSALDGLSGDTGVGSVGDRERCPSTPATSDFPYGDGPPLPTIEFEQTEKGRKTNGEDGGEGWGRHLEDDPGENGSKFASASEPSTTGGAEQQEAGGLVHDFSGWKTRAGTSSPPAGNNPTRGVPLVVDGANLKVDWADPLRYHIHLNGGIKGPCAPPELLTERPSARPGVPTGIPVAVGGVGVHGPEWRLSQGIMRPSPDASFSTRWSEADFPRARPSRPQPRQPSSRQPRVESPPMQPDYAVQPTGSVPRRERERSISDLRGGCGSRRGPPYNYDHALTPPRQDDSNSGPSRGRASSFVGIPRRSAYPPVHRQPGQDFHGDPSASGQEVLSYSIQERFQPNFRLGDRTSSVGDSLDHTWPHHSHELESRAHLGRHNGNGSRHNGCVSGGGIYSAGSGTAVYSMGPSREQRAWGVSRRDEPYRSAAWDHPDNHCGVLVHESSWSGRGPEDDMINSGGMNRPEWVDGGRVESVLPVRSSISPEDRQYKPEPSRGDLMAYPAVHYREPASRAERQDEGTEGREWSRPGGRTRRMSESSIITLEDRRLPPDTWTTRQCPSSPAGFPAYADGFETAAHQSVSSSSPPHPPTLGARCHSASPALGAHEYSCAQQGEPRVSTQAAFSIRSSCSPSGPLEAIGSSAAVDSDRHWLRSGGTSCWQVGADSSGPGITGDGDSWCALQVDPGAHRLDSGAAGGSGGRAAFRSDMPVSSRLWKAIDADSVNRRNSPSWSDALLPSDERESWVFRGE